MFVAAQLIAAVTVGSLARWLFAAISPQPHTGDVNAHIREGA